MTMNAQERLKALLAAKTKTKVEVANVQVQQKKPEEESKVPEESNGTNAISTQSNIKEKSNEQSRLQALLKVQKEEQSPKQDSGQSTQVTPSKVELDPSHPLYLPMVELEEKLNKNLPGFESILRDIHLHCGKDPECVTILTDEEIGIILQGLNRVGGEVVTVSAKSTTKKKAPIVAGML